MKIAVIGATGLVGNAVVQELATRGHNVTAFARNTDKVLQNDKVTAVSADVNDTNFAEKLAGFDAVVSAYNPGWTNPNYVEDFHKSYTAILSAAKAANVAYLLIVGGAGSLYVAPNLQLVDTAEFPKEYYGGANAARELLNTVKASSGLNWAFISPAAMFAVNPVSFDRTGKYRLGQDDVLFTAEGAPADISVADLAVAIADDVENKAHLHQRFTVAAE
ncbi:NAD(P)-dependent oxidoreductase [Ursidibacter sp. B-7004-1]